MPLTFSKAGALPAFGKPRLDSPPPPLDIMENKKIYNGKVFSIFNIDVKVE